MAKSNDYRPITKTAPSSRGLGRQVLILQTGIRIPVGSQVFDILLLMLKKIFLNDQEFHFSKSHLPLLIHGEHGSGSSLFTMTMLADLYAQGAKVVDLTGFSMAREEFIKQTESNENAHLFTKDQSDEFITFVSQISNHDNYVILIKNIELFDNEIFNVGKDFKNLILSGDVNKCSFKEKLLQKAFTTKIYFSALDKTLPQLQKYQGFLVSENLQGIMSLEV